MLSVACSGPGVSRTRNLSVTSPILYQLDHCTHTVADRFTMDCHVRPVCVNSLFLVAGGRYLVLPSGTLLIANSTREDTGSYRCTAYNPVADVRVTSPLTYRLHVRPGGQYKSLYFPADFHDLPFRADCTNDAYL